jgi:predicted permease
MSFDMIGQLLRNLRYGARAMRKSRGFTAVAVLSLALGIGTATALFSVVYGVLISPYPYAKPDEIWAPRIQDLKNPRQGRGSHWLREYLEIRKLPAFTSVMATSGDNLLLTGDHAPESIQGVLLSANAMQFLGVPPVIGRTILPSDLKPSGEPEQVTVISYKAWQRWFSGDPNAIGKTLILNDRSYTVIGVMPPRFGWYGNDSLWLPLSELPREDRMTNVIMRLAPGVSPQAAQEQLQALHLRLAQENPKNFPQNGFTTRLTNYMDMTVASGEMRSSLLLLFGAVGFLLLIACANVANLQLARATTRAREIVIRMSVGAGRSLVIRQLLTESVLLSLIGGVLGLLFSIVLTRGIVVLMPEFYLPNEARVTVNTYVLAFSAAVSVLTGILFGLAPAIQCSRLDLVEALKDSPRSAGAGNAGSKTRNVLVVIEVALSVVLLAGASLTIRGFVARSSENLGFNPERILMVSLPLPPQRYVTYDQRIHFAQSVIERVKSLPGVQSAAIGNGGFPYGGPQSGFTLPGKPKAEQQRITVALISADYPQVLAIPLRKGRSLSEQDIARGEHLALINETASRLWPAGEDPIGSSIRLDLLENPGGQNLTRPGGSPEVTVAGIIGDTKPPGARNSPRATVFVPFTLVAPTFRTVALRTSGPPMLLLNAVRGEVRALDKNQPVARPITVEEILGFETMQPRFNMSLFAFFGMLGLALAAAGIYCVLSYSVARRTHEIGVRVALGAQRRDVIGLMLGTGGRLVAVGMIAGLTGSIALARYLHSEIFEVPATDPLAISGVVVVLSAAALLACYVPARRAARLDATAALRHE